MMASAKYIDITFVNRTEQKDCSVVVFMQNESANSDPLVAWRVFKTQRPARLRFPWAVAVGAEWKEKGQINIAGPCTAPLGSTWNFQLPRTLQQGNVATFFNTLCVMKLLLSNPCLCIDVAVFHHTYKLFGYQKPNIAKLYVENASFSCSSGF